MQHKLQKGGANAPTDADDEGELGLRLDVEVARVLGNALHADLIAVSLAVLGSVLLSALEDGATSGLGLLQRQRKFSLVKIEHQEIFEKKIKDLLLGGLGNSAGSLDLSESFLGLEDGLGDRGLGLSGGSGSLLRGGRHAI